MNTTRMTWAALLLTAGCGGVSQAQYDAAVADSSKERGRAAELEKQNQALQADLAKAKTGKPAPPAENAAELAELKRQKAAADARLRQMDDLSKRFKKMIDSGKLEVTVRRGQIVLALETDVLFDPGKTEIKTDGKTALKEVADAIKTVPGRRFQVAGHTDTTPIKTKEFPSNWELSTARAVTVVKLLASEGVKASVLSAAGYAEFDPVGNNATNPGRAKNRRIEIVLLPTTDELVMSPELTAREKAKDKDEAPPKK
ncbi:MAG TPA: OmpA family protein [Polyangiaceae bacterium]|jgi:chemotaxis protein MotB|nr:OmpA family protein [Polyangiaceae bacterium]